MKKDYTKYNVTDFARDDSFIKWVQSPTDELDKQWNSFLDKYPEKGQAVREARDLIKSLHMDETGPGKEQVEMMWAEIDRKTRSQADMGRIVPLRWLAFAAAAAAIAFFLVFQFLGSETMVSTGYADLAFHRLPDGSTISLNAGSTIEYDKEKWLEDRVVRLEGEAFFKVVKGAPFKVKTDLGVVEVLGTSFNVYERENQFNVACFTGRVRVSNDMANDVELTPGQRVDLTQTGDFELKTFENAGQPDWQQGYFTFSDRPLWEVFDEIERQFDVEIQVSQDIGARHATVFFETGDLDSAMYRITWPMGLEYEIRNDLILIKE